LPSIVPSYIYMLAAMTAVGTLLILSFNSYATTLRFVPETEQLMNLLSRVAARAIELLTITNAGSNISTYLDLPTAIGEREYWVRLRNDTLQSWVEGGLGQIWSGRTPYKVFLPGAPSVTGYYISDFGPAVLECFVNDSVSQLILTTWR
jgi:hypothetical protein